VLSALKKADGRESIVMRLFNPDATAVESTIASATRVLEAHQLDLLERRQQALAARAGAVAVTLGPHAIRTVELVVERSLPRDQRPADGRESGKQ